MIEGWPNWLTIPALVLGWLASAMLVGWLWEEFIGSRPKPPPPQQ